MFKHVARCPVCKKVIDEITTPTKELPGQIEAMILGDSRREHGKESESCTYEDDWIKGWIVDAPVKEATK